MTLEARVLGPEVYLLGEGASWDAERGIAHWVDILRGQLFEGHLDGDSIESTMVYQREGTLGAAVRAEGGGYLLATTETLVRIDDDGREIGELRIVPEGMTSRLNDGATDPAGRYIVGSMDFDEKSGGQLLVSVDHDGRTTVLDDDIVISNGLGWSPDGGTFYSIDSVPGTVWVRDYDPGTGAVGTRHQLLGADFGGFPDGMTVDAEGNLWIAVWGGSEVQCYSPQGKLLEVVRTTAPQTSSVAFAGDDLSTLFITSASREPGPDAGKLFTIDVNVRGRATTPWRPSF
jgi:sugar lactone lactonase YvrE